MALIQANDLISRLKEGLAMAGDHNHGTCLTAREQGSDEFGFRLDVERGGGLIHEDDRIFTKESTGQGDALSLTTRKIGAWRHIVYFTAARLALSVLVRARREVKGADSA